METSKHIVPSHCKSFKTKRKRDLKGLLINMIQKTEFRKTCSPMSCKNSDQKASMAPGLDLIVVFPLELMKFALQSVRGTFVCCLQVHRTPLEWRAPGTGQTMALLCLSVEGLLHLWCYHQKKNSNNTTNKNTDKANLHFTYHETPKDLLKNKVLLTDSSISFNFISVFHTVIQFNSLPHLILYLFLLFFLLSLKMFFSPAKRRMW